MKEWEIRTAGEVSCGSKTKQAYELIKQKILMLEFAPGQPLRELELSEQLSMSRTPFSRRFSAGRSTHARLASGGRNTLAIAWLRSGAAAVIPRRCHGCTSARFTPIRLSSSLR